MSHSAHPGAAEMYRAVLAQQCLCGSEHPARRATGGAGALAAVLEPHSHSIRINAMMDCPTSRPRNLFLRRIIIVHAILYGVGTIFGGMWLGEVATHPGRRPITSADEAQVRLYASENKIDFRDASITARDGATLRGWFFRPAQANGSTVILLHGVSDNRLGMFGYGRWLLANHYSVLLPDARAHGLSGGIIATYGLLESDDIPRWANWIS